VSKFHIRLRELRQSRGISMQKLAKYLGISKSSINMYERGEREPGLDMIEAIADFFNVDVDYLLGKCNIPNKALVSGYTLPEIKPPSEVDPDQFVLDMYKKLDVEDKAEIRGEMKQMLKGSKYKKKKSDINAVFHTNSTDDDSATLALQTTTSKN